MQWKNVQMYYSYKVLERIADLCVLLYYFIQTKSYKFDLTDKVESVSSTIDTDINKTLFW